MASQSPDIRLVPSAKFSAFAVNDGSKLPPPPIKNDAKKGAKKDAVSATKKTDAKMDAKKDAPAAAVAALDATHEYYYEQVRVSIQAHI